MTTYSKSGKTYETEIRSIWEVDGHKYMGFRAKLVPDGDGVPFFIPELASATMWNLTKLVTHLMEEGYETIRPEL